MFTFSIFNQSIKKSIMFLTLILAFFSLTCHNQSHPNSTHERVHLEVDGSPEVAIKTLDSSSDDQVRLSLDKTVIETNQTQRDTDATPDRSIASVEVRSEKTTSPESHGEVSDHEQNDEQVATGTEKDTPAIQAMEVPEHTGGVIIPEPSAVVDMEDPDHGLFNTLLQTYVSSVGKVNYEGIKSNTEILDSYIKLLQDNPINSDWSRDARLAYWINAYNAFTIKLIVDNFPINSIMDLDGGKTWDKSWITIGDKSYSLNDIEHQIIRPTFKDPRIHFAVNCAAKSCPPIANRAFTEGNVNTLLEQRTRQFINNSLYNQIDGEQVKVSKIFDWYAEDFGDLGNYLNKYLENKIPQDADIEFIDYDWRLNN